MNEHELQISLKTPDPDFIRNFALSEFSLVPKEHLQPDHLSWKTHPIGAGPYKVAVLNADQSEIQVVKAGPLSNKECPDIINFTTRYQGKDLDLIIGKLPSAEGENLVPLKLKVPASLLTIFFNYSTPLANNDMFRRAVNMAIDRSALAATAGNEALPNASLVPSNLCLIPNRDSDADPEGAKLLFARVTDFDRRLAIPIFEAHPNPWQLELLKQLSRAGLEVKYQPKSRVPLSPESTCPLEIHGLVPNVGNPAVLYSMFCDGAPYGPIAKTRSSFQAQVSEALAASTPEIRKQILIDIDQTFTEETRAIPLFEKSLTYFINKEKIENLGEQYQRQVMQFHQIKMR